MNTGPLAEPPFHDAWAAPTAPESHCLACWPLLAPRCPAQHLKYLGLDHNRLRAVPPDFSLLAQRVPVSIKKNPWTALPDRWNNK